MFLNTNNTNQYIYGTASSTCVTTRMVLTPQLVYELEPERCEYCQVKNDPTNQFCDGCGAVL